MNVGQVCTRPAVSVSVSASLAEAASLMREQNVGAVVVTKSLPDRPVAVGVITDRDIVRAQLEHTTDLTRLSVEQAMSRKPLEISEDSELETSIRHLRARGVRRAPVIASDGTLVGVVSSDDLVAHLAENLIGLACILAKQPHA